MDVIAGYKVLELLHIDGRTAIYRVQAVANGRTFVIKLPTSAYPAASENARLRHQYILTKELDITGIIRVHDLERIGNKLALVQEDFGTVALDQFMAEQPLTSTQFLEIAIQLVRTLQLLHQRHIVHKDIKPANIIVDEETCEVRLTDFGIASQLSQESQAVSNVQTFEGSPAYASPEQTGRMNRAVDYRSDFYSLGVTFYEMLTGRLPFISQDFLELIHAHIALRPLPPTEINPHIPTPLSEMVLKLMAKTAEERYQSAYGLLSDLAMCQQQWQLNGRIDPFPLAQNDIADHFTIPQKLYGREREIQRLLKAFERAAEGEQLLMIITGAAGIGKSVLVQEVHKPIVQRRGYYIAGKFDQLARNIPYNALIQAFQEMVRQLLTESPAEIAVWKTRLLDAVGPNGQLINDVIPDMELIIGPQAAVPQLDPAEAQNRFNTLFYAFMSVFAQAEHPLTLFLDDLQWADAASLKLIQTLATGAPLPHLFLIGAYRDNEVDAAHPLMMTLTAIEKGGLFTVQRLELTLLDEGDIADLLADALYGDRESVAPLAKLVQQKTQGNPFFVNEFLLRLDREKVLWFSPENGRWEWRTEQIERLGITANVVDLMTDKIRRLPAASAAVLQIAACIGNEFALDELAAAAATSALETASNLWPALAEGLLIPLEAAYKFIHNQEVDEEESHAINNLAAEVRYRFAHDRIQQAAYALIDPFERPQMHLRIGRHMLGHLEVSEQEEHLFATVNHLNEGVDLLVDEAEQLQVARLNLQAAAKARTSTAYDAAVGYARVGTDLLPEDSWQSDYALTLALYREQAQNAQLSGHADEAADLFKLLLQNAHNKFDRTDVYAMQMVLYLSQMRLQETLETGIEALSLFDYELSLTPAPAAIGAEIGAEHQTRGARPIADLINLPVMAEPEQVAIMKILTNMLPAAYLSTQMGLWSLILVKMVNLSLNYGNTLASSIAYVSYGIILAAQMKNYKAAYQFSLLALQIIEKFPDTVFEPKIKMVMGSLLNHWQAPLAENFTYLRESFIAGLNCGDLFYAGYSQSFLPLYQLWHGMDSLAEVRAVAVQTMQFGKRIGMVDVQLYGQLVLYMADYLTGASDHIAGEADIALLLAQKRLNTVFWYKMGATWVHLWYGDLALPDLLGLCEEAGQYVASSVGTMARPIFVFTHALVLAAVCRAAGDKAEREEQLAQIERYLQELSDYEAGCAANFQHLRLLVTAELTRTRGVVTEALQLFEQAIASAHEYHYPMHAALASELVAQLYLELGLARAAHPYLNDAYYGYKIWGATAKVQRLESQYDLWSSGQKKSSAAQTHPFYRRDNPMDSTNEQHATVALDVSSVVKASQAIAEEIVLDQLLAKLIDIAIENAGAERGVLLLEREGELVIAAVGYADRQSISIEPLPLATSDLVSPAIINYVVHAKKPLVLADAYSDNRFLNDSYVSQQQPKSLLCVPLLQQDLLKGLFYLENNLATDAFTPERIELINLISAQVAIAIDNATLYSQLEEYSKNLEQKVGVRTAELMQAKREAEDANKAKSDFLASMSHELRTPLNAIIGYSEMLEEDAVDLGYEEIGPDLHKIKTAGRLLLTLINSVLDLSKIEAGRMEMFLETFDISVLFDELATTIYPLLQQNDNELVLIIDKQNIGVMYADLNKVRQSLLNLLSNASKFTKNGRVTLSAERQLIDDKEWMILTVADTGMGMTPAQAARVFKPYQQGEASTSRNFGGTGLGMAITKEFCEMMGGWVELKTAVDKGASFTLYLPAVVEAK